MTWTQPRLRSFRSVVKFAALSVGLLISQPRTAHAEAEHVSVFLLTFGPGTHPFFKFGHNAIWIADRLERTNEVYNWGTFNFDSFWLIPQFLLGRFEYWLSVDDIGFTVASYRAENRSVTAQELSLSGEQKLQLIAALAKNAEPENRKYRYDYYGDNCSTRPRDVLDRVLGGALREVSRAPAPMTFRQHTLRLTSDLLWEYVGLDLLMGDFIDKPITEWQEMFLPAKLQAIVRRVTLADGSPLVRSERVLVPTTMKPPPDVPPGWIPYFVVAGWMLGAAVWLMGQRSALVPVAMAVVLATLGSIFLALWLGTDHFVAYGNENLFICSPLLWLLVPALARQRESTRSLKVAQAVLVSVVLGFGLKALPWFDQDSWRVFFLFAPTAIALSLLTMRLPARD